MAKHESASEWEWVILSEEEKAAVCPENVDPIENDPCWSCNHCAVHLDLWEPRRNVVDHLKTVYVFLGSHTPALTLFAGMKLLTGQFLVTFSSFPGNVARLLGFLSSR
jgi:hypothetical protein